MSYLNIIRQERRECKDGTVRTFVVLSCSCGQDRCRKEFACREDHYYTRRPQICLRKVQPVHKLTRTWGAMMDRCSNQNHTHYEHYGGRGIKVCSEWSTNKQAFFEWAEDKYKPGLKLNRIDNDGNYEPVNCNFITTKENNRNKSNNIAVVHNGKRYCLTEYLEVIKCPLPRRLVYHRLQAGWSIDAAVTTPTMTQFSNRSKDCINGE